MSINYPKENRMYTDDINSNFRLYRESEKHGKIYHDTLGIRTDQGFQKQIYEEIFDPEKAYQDIQGKMYKSELNNDQKHFPMLREYEKAKMAMQNNDGLNSSQNRFGYDVQNSPFQNFMRTTTGKKLYYENNKTGPMPPPKLTQRTKLQDTRQRFIYRDKNGQPLLKTNKLQDFLPANPYEAREMISFKDIEKQNDEYDLKRYHDFYEQELSKKKRLAGEFTKSNFYDNGQSVDEFGFKKVSNFKSKKVQLNQNLKISPSKSQKQLNNTNDQSRNTESQSTVSSKKLNFQPLKTRMRMTNEKFENNRNCYQTFLNDKSELPRLSILDNYNQIIRIMTNSYIKGNEYQNKFKNRMEKDIINDEEYQKFQEEQVNTKKMATILKSLNAPFQRKKRQPESAQTIQTGLNKQSVQGSQTLGNKSINQGSQNMSRYNSSMKPPLANLKSDNPATSKTIQHSNQDFSNDGLIHLQKI